MSSLSDLISSFDRRQGVDSYKAFSASRVERKRHRKSERRAVELVRMRQGLLRHHSYCTDKCVERRTEQRAANANFLASKVLEKDGVKRSLAALADDAKRGRIAELYAYTKGVQDSAELKGWTWIFVTLTAPPEFHAMPVLGVNSWDPDLSPLDSHGFIFDRWRRAYKRLKKAGVDFAGIRCVEPHKDGTAHWHLMIFADVDALIRIVETVFKLWAPRSSDRSSTRPSTAKIILANGTATAASYFLKYVEKNVEVSDAVTRRVDAWRGCWGIRSIQSFGCPSLTAWRRLRKIDADYVAADPELKLSHAAANAPSGEQFFRFMGGVGRGCRRVVAAVDSRSEAKYRSRLQMQADIADTAARLGNSVVGFYSSMAFRSCKHAHKTRCREIDSRPIAWVGVKNLRTGFLAIVKPSGWTLVSVNSPST